MKKFLLSVLAIATIGCQKDYYLDDLQDAEREIAQLESIRQSQQELIQDLQSTVDQITGNLEEANDQIASLEQIVLEVNYENDLLNLNVDLLKFIVAQREFTIDSLLNVTAQQSATIAIHEETIRNLNDEIISLNSALTEANELATQQAARIVELENQPPVYIHVVSYRDRWRTQIINQAPEVGTASFNYSIRIDDSSPFQGYVYQIGWNESTRYANYSTSNGSSSTITFTVQPKSGFEWNQTEAEITNSSNWSLTYEANERVGINVQSITFANNRATFTVNLTADIYETEDQQFEILINDEINMFSYWADFDLTLSTGSSSNPINNNGVIYFNVPSANYSWLSSNASNPSRIRFQTESGGEWHYGDASILHTSNNGNALVMQVDLDAPSAFPVGSKDIGGTLFYPQSQIDDWKTEYLHAE